MIPASAKLFLKKWRNNLLWSVNGCAPPDKVGELVDWIASNPAQATLLAVDPDSVNSFEAGETNRLSATGAPSSKDVLNPQHFIATLKNGRALRRAGDIIAPDNTLVVNTRGFAQRMGRLPPIKRVAGRLAVLTNGPSRNYYHWMIEVLPLLAILQQSPLKPDKYFVRYNLPFHRKTLLELGIKQDQIIPATRYSHIEAEELLVPSRHISYKFACRFLRQSFGPERISDKPSARIYVSRGNASKRRVRNETELVRMLADYSFEAVELSGMSVLEQAELFQSAEYIIGPHGAGFTNIFFSQKSTTLIELFAGRELPRFFVDICRDIGIEHRQFSKTQIASQRPSTLFRKTDRDFFVDIDELRMLFESLGIEKSRQALRQENEKS